MVKSFEYTTSYPFPWESVALGFFRRYPNPFSLHVLTEDVLEQEIRDGKLYTKRLLTKTNALPNWGKRFFKNKARRAIIIEESLIDLENGVIESFTRNIGFTTRVMYVTEHNLYSLSGTNPNETLVQKRATIESKFYGLRKALEAFGVERFKKNTEKANQGYIYVLYKLATQNNHNIPYPTKATSASASHQEIKKIQPVLSIGDVTQIKPEIQQRFWRKVLSFSWIYYFIGSSKS